MLRIDRTVCADGVVRFKLEGRLVAPWVGLLEEQCQTHLRRHGTPLRVDLSAVSFASEEGIDLLRRLEREGIACKAWSPLLQALAQSTREVP